MKRSKMMWAVLHRSGYATHRLYSAARAKRFVRLAKRWGHDVYAARFGKVTAASTSVEERDARGMAEFRAHYRAMYARNDS